MAKKKKFLRQTTHHRYNSDDVRVFGTFVMRERVKGEFATPKTRREKRNAAYQAKIDAKKRGEQ